VHLPLLGPGDCWGQRGYAALAAFVVMGGRIEGEGPRVVIGEGEGEGEEVVRVVVVVVLGAREDMVTTTLRLWSSATFGSGDKNLRCCSGSSQCSDGIPCESPNTKKMGRGGGEGGEDGVWGQKTATKKILNFLRIE